MNIGKNVDTCGKQLQSRHKPLEIFLTTCFTALHLPHSQHDVNCNQQCSYQTLLIYFFCKGCPPPGQSLFSGLFLPPRLTFPAFCSPDFQLLDFLHCRLLRHPPLRLCLFATLARKFQRLRENHVACCGTAKLAIKLKRL